MAIGDQGTQAQALGLDASQIADAVNRQKIGSQRQRNEMMRLGTSDPNAFALQNKQQLQQATQPSEMWGAGRQLASNQNVQGDEFGLIDQAAPKLGGDRYYYGNTDWTTNQGLQSLYDKTGYTQYKEQQARNAYKPTSIQDLLTSIGHWSTKAPEVYGDNDPRVMPANREMLDQRDLAAQISQFNPDAYSDRPGLGIGTGDIDWRGVNQQALLKKPMDDFFNAKVFGAYSPLTHQEDPYVKFLNSKYKPTTNGWDLGDGKLYTPIKSFQGNDWYGLNGPTGNAEMDSPTFSQAIEKDWADAFTPEGKFNKEGWHVTQPKSHAMQGILGTLSVIAPALFYGLGMVGTAAGEGGAAAGGTGTAVGEGGASVAGSSAAIPAGSEGLMTGSLATEAAPAAAGASTGMFGNSNLDMGNAWLNRAGEGAIRGAVGSGGNLKSILGGALSGGIGSTINSNLSGLGKYLTDQGLSSNVANSITDFASGAGGSLVKNLFGKNSGQEMLQGALASGVGKTLGGVFNRGTDVTDPLQQKQNYGTAQTLAQLFRRIK